MFKNLYIGDKAANQSVKVLILGESHYESDGEIDGTAGVVNYLAVQGNDNNTQFYKNIMRTFGYEITLEQRNLFWNNIYCGNYISELCGIRENNTAAKKIKAERRRYNNELFTCIDHNKIDVVICFSRLVYNNLPGFAENETEEVLIAHPSNSLKKFMYYAGSHKNCDVDLERNVTVYGLRHPSAGFSPSTYWEYFKMYKK